MTRGSIAKRLLAVAMIGFGGLVAGEAIAEGPADLLEDLPSGPAGAAVFVLVGGALCAMGLPRQVVCYGAGLTFGLGPGMALAMAAQLLGCVADVALARGLGRDWARRRLHGRMARLDRFVTAEPFSATLVLRLLPFGSNLLLNLAAGLSGVALVPFLMASFVGYLPQTAIFALLASGARLREGVQTGVAIALAAASLGLGLVLMRRFREALNAAESPDLRDAIRPR